MSCLLQQALADKPHQQAIAACGMTRSPVGGPEKQIKRRAANLGFRQAICCH